MEDQFNTMKHNPIVGTGNEARDILMFVYQALQVKGYDPVDQLVGYMITGDPTYITSYNSARSLIGRVERDTLLEELVRSYLETHLASRRRCAAAPPFLCRGEVKDGAGRCNRQKAVPRGETREDERK